MELLFSFGFLNKIGHEKERFLLIVVVFFFKTLFCQDKTIEWGPVVKEKDGFYMYADDPIIPVQGGFIEFKNEKGITLNKYDYTGKLIAAINYKDVNGIDVSDIDFNQVLQVGKLYYRVFLVKDKKANLATYYVCQIVSDGFSKKNTKLFTVPYNHQFASSPNAVMDDIERDEIIQSPDGKLLVRITGKLAVQTADEEILITIIDSSFKMISQKNYLLKQSDHRVNFEHAVVTNEGEVFMLGKFNEGNAYSLKKDYHYEIYRFNDGNFTAQTIEYSNNEKVVKAKLFVSMDGNAAVAGYYSFDKSSLWHVDGVFAAALNGSGVIKANTYPFSIEFMASLQFGATEAKEGNLAGVQMWGLHNMPDGSFVIVAREMHDNSSLEWTNGYIITRFSINGKLLNIQKVVKPLGIGGYLPPSIKTYIVDNSVAIIYNYAVATGEKGKNAAKAITEICYVDEKGKLEFQKITNPNLDNIPYCTTILQLDNGKYIIKTSDENGYQYGTFSIETR